MKQLGLLIKRWKGSIVSILVLIGIAKLPRFEMHWMDDSLLHQEVVSSVMSRQDLQSLTHCLPEYQHLIQTVKWYFYQWNHVSTQGQAVFQTTVFHRLMNIFWILEIERIQRGAARWVKSCYIREPRVVTNFVKELAWTSLQRRSLNAGLQLVWNDVNNTVWLHCCPKMRFETSQTVFWSLPCY